MWKGVTSSFQFVQALDEHIRSQAREYPRTIPDLSDGGMLIAASDYTGTHRRYDVMGFVVTSQVAWQRWDDARRRVREMFRLGARRFSYTKLNDKHKLRALEPFLHAITQAEGFLCCVAINRDIPSFVNADGTDYAKDPLLEKWKCWKPDVFERMLRATSIVSLLTAGLASENQEVGWVTDEDEIASNREQVENLAQVFGSMAGQYSSGRIVRVRVMTTAGDTGERESEDLASVADLAAGTIADVFTAFDRQGLRIDVLKHLSVPNDVPPKTIRIGEWLRLKDQPLRRLLFVAEKGQKHGDVTIVPVSFT